MGSTKKKATPKASRKKPGNDAPSGGLLKGSLAGLGDALYYPAPTRSWWDGPSALVRAMDPEAARKWDEEIRQANEDRARGARQRVIETFSVVHEPAWLAESKSLYSDLGLYLSAVSHESGLGKALDPDLRKYAEAKLRRFVARLGSHAPETMELRFLMTIIDDVVHRRKELANRVTDGQADVIPGRGPAGAVAFMFGMVNFPRAQRLDAELRDSLERVISAWPSKSPKPPTKWNHLAGLWQALTGNKLDPQSVRRTWTMGPGKTRKT